MDLTECAAIDALNEEAFAMCFPRPRLALEMASAAADRAEAVRYRSGLGFALRTAGASRCLTSDLDRAAADLAAAHQIFAELRDDLGLAHVGAWLGSLARRAAGPGAAMEHYIDALETFRRHGDRAAEASVLVSIGNIHVDLRSFGRALEAFAAARRIASEIGHRHLLLMTSGNIAGVYAECGDNERGFDLLREALSVAREEGNEMLEAVTLLNVAIVGRRLARPEFDSTWLQKALAKLREVGMRREEGTALLELGDLHEAAGELEEALERYSACVALGRLAGDRICELEGLVHTGVVLGRLGRDEAAEEHLLRAVAQGRSYGFTVQESEAHQALAAVYEMRGNLESAICHLKHFQAAWAKHQVAEQETLLRAREEVEAVERAGYDAKLQAVRSELQVLKAQLQPHFLMNALNAAATLVHRDAAAADELLVRLGELLRMALRQSSDPEVSLRQELDFVARYLEVEQLRLQRTLRVTMDVDPAVLDARVPNLILQPLAENAIRHGLLDRHEAPELSFCGFRADDGVLVLRVADNGAGLPRNRNPRLGVGLRNTRERLIRLYGAGCTLELIPRESGGTCAVLRLPLPGRTTGQRSLALTSSQERSSTPRK